MCSLRQPLNMCYKPLDTRTRAQQWTLLLRLPLRRSLRNERRMENIMMSRTSTSYSFAYLAIVPPVAKQLQATVDKIGPGFPHLTPRSISCLLSSYCAKASPPCPLFPSDTLSRRGWCGCPTR